VKLFQFGINIRIELNKFNILGQKFYFDFFDRIFGEIVRIFMYYSLSSLNYLFRGVKDDNEEDNIHRYHNFYYFNDYNYSAAFHRFLQVYFNSIN